MSFKVPIEIELTHDPPSWHVLLHLLLVSLCVGLVIALFHLGISRSFLRAQISDGAAGVIFLEIFNNRGRLQIKIGFLDFLAVNLLICFKTIIIIICVVK